MFRPLFPELAACSSLAAAVLCMPYMIHFPESGENLQGKHAKNGPPNPPIANLQIQIRTTRQRGDQSRLLGNLNDDLGLLLFHFLFLNTVP